MLKTRTVAVLTTIAVSLALGATDASAQRRGGGGGGGHRSPAGSGGVSGRAAPRVGVPPRSGAPIYRGGYYPTRIAPRFVGAYPYRPYYYPYRAGLTVGFYSSFGAPYRYGYYGYPYYPYDYTVPLNYGPYPYGYTSYRSVLPPPGYVTAVPGYEYGGVRIQGAPEDAQVFVDGYYVGIVDDFDGALQHLNLQSGPHRIEVRPQGFPPVSFDVNVTPGQTLTYHAGMR